MGRQQTYFREEGREKGRAGGRDVVRPAQLSLAPVDIHPSGPSPCSHAPGAVREEVGWTYGGEGMDGEGGVWLRDRLREKEGAREDDEGLLGH